MCTASLRFWYGGPPATISSVYMYCTFMALVLMVLYSGPAMIRSVHVYYKTLCSVYVYCKSDVLVEVLIVTDHPVGPAGPAYVYCKFKV